MNQINTISIICICDNHYAILMAALIKSVEQNHVSEENLEFFIIEDNISQKNKERINKCISKEQNQIHWLKMSDCIPDGYKLPVDKSSLPLNIYIRLFIPIFINQERINKILFLDVDMIMLEDVSKLWNVDLGDNIVAAVQDQFIKIVSRWGGLANYEQLGLDSETKYFNAGLMLIDLNKWRQEKITDKVISAITDYKEHALFQDQYGLNVALANKWLVLDPLWNRFAYSEEEKPYLIHFTGRKPIYKTYEFSQHYRSLFYHYLKQTDWKNFKPISETHRYLKKASNFVEKFLNMLKQ